MVKVHTGTVSVGIEKSELTATLSITCMTTMVAKIFEQNAAARKDNAIKELLPPLDMASHLTAFCA